MATLANNRLVPSISRDSNPVQLTSSPRVEYEEREVNFMQPNESKRERGEHISTCGELFCNTWDLSNIGGGFDELELDTRDLFLQMVLQLHYLGIDSDSMFNSCKEHFAAGIANFI